MDEKKIRDTLGKIVPDDSQKERMLDAIISGEDRKKRKQPYNALPYIVAAALVLLISFTLYKLPRQAPSPVTPPVAEGPGATPVNPPPPPVTASPDFPTQSVSPEKSQVTFDLNESAMGMGYMGLLYYSREEITDRNPWTREMVLPSLPVFRNTFLVNAAGEPDKYFTPAEKRVRAAEIASLLGTSLTQKDGDGSYYLAEDGTEIIVRDNLEATLIMKAPELDPAVTHDDPDAFEAQVAKRYTERYPELFRIKHPVYETTYDYSFSGERYFRTRVFSRPDKDVDAILNYAFNSYHISAVADQGVHVYIHLPGPYLFEKVQEYPLIGAEEAEAALLRGDFLTTVPYEETITAEDIASTRLVYHTSIFSEFFQPVYEFHVELENDRQENGLITYGLYYVPALRPEYVEVILDDIPFN